MMPFHQGLLMSGVVGPTIPSLNSIDAWFSGGGLGLYYHVDPYYCFSDSSGTVNCVVGDPVVVMKDSGPGSFHLGTTAVDLSSKPLLQYDSSIGRYYLDHTSASLQRLSSEISSVVSDWKWLHDGTEWQSVARVQYGKSSNPNALYALWSTQVASSSRVGTLVFFDDRSGVSINNAQRQIIGKGSSPAIADINIQNVITPNAVQIISQSFAYGVAGNDVILRVNSSVTGGVESGGAPSSGNPQGRFTMGADVSAGGALDGRIYSLAILRGAGSRTGVSTFEADI